MANATRSASSSTAALPRSVRAGLTVLANLAVPVDEFDVAELAGVIKDTEEDVADEKEGWKRDKLAHRLERLKALQAALAALTRVPGKFLKFLTTCS